ncbi:class I SAM-dependent methyltransferase [Pseudobacteriovorax antillogorgiicola]|uniref:Methyltransferase domain-containing protein n=1 Tax=Pseudobacteriovorax antillogorgiicola TaxID=1513793 RepID=A0A1Y6CLG3_9BACT|nr:class I SAM-dependent methyltransferase [Pseudobacteriovorax antillogorgiicola]TCS45202.1 methyltransferase family protein [Pseudobacteriovorax antillogorgiicola]SMF75525.1 Methyltransferase domain-containing protein [Pseudobacteriovorax antillogorgiicola]
MKEVLTTDPIWEKKYSSNSDINRYPWDIVVSQIFRSCSTMDARRNFSILEVGCGTGNNLWFASREGFTVTGIDSSQSAISYAKSRFEREGLEGDFVVGDVTKLPFGDSCFDMVIDRAALTCLGRTAFAISLSEIHRVLVNKGKFLFNPYSDRHSSKKYGERFHDGLTKGINAGGVAGAGQIRFYSIGDIEDAFEAHWEITKIEHRENIDMTHPEYLVHSEWVVEATKVMR